MSGLRAWAVYICGLCAGWLMHEGSWWALVPIVCAALLMADAA